jgi:hypothetical protein
MLKRIAADVLFGTVFTVAIVGSAYVLEGRWLLTAWGLEFVAASVWQVSKRRPGRGSRSGA